MKSVSEMTQAEILQAAMRAIERELGIVGLIRFLQAQKPGSGDYVKDRKQWLKDYKSVEELSADIMDWQKNHPEDIPEKFRQQ